MIKPLKFAATITAAVIAMSLTATTAFAGAPEPDIAATAAEAPADPTPLDAVLPAAECAGIIVRAQYSKDFGRTNGNLSVWTSGWPLYGDYDRAFLQVDVEDLSGTRLFGQPLTAPAGSLVRGQLAEPALDAGEYRVVIKDYRLTPDAPRTAPPGRGDCRTEATFTVVDPTPPPPVVHGRSVSVSLDSQLCANITAKDYVLQGGIWGLRIAATDIRHGSENFLVTPDVRISIPSPDGLSRITVPNPSVGFHTPGQFNWFVPIPLGDEGGIGVQINPKYFEKSPATCGGTSTTPTVETPTDEPSPRADGLKLSAPVCEPGGYIVRDDSSQDDDAPSRVPAWFKLSDVSDAFDIAYPTARVTGFAPFQSVYLMISAQPSGNRSVDWSIQDVFAPSDGYDPKTGEVTRQTNVPERIKADANGVVSIPLTLPTFGQGDKLRKLIRARLMYKQAGGGNTSFDIPLDTVTVDKSCGGSALDDENSGTRGKPITVPVLENDTYSDVPLVPATVKVANVPDGVSVEVNRDRSVSVMATPSYEPSTIAFDYELEDFAGTYTAKVTVSLSGKPALVTPTTKPKPHEPTPPKKADALPPTGAADHLGLFAGLGGLLVLAGGSLLAYRRRLGGACE